MEVPDVADRRITGKKWPLTPLIANAKNILILTYRNESAQLNTGRDEARKGMFRGPPLFRVISIYV